MLVLFDRRYQLLFMMRLRQKAVTAKSICTRHPNRTFTKYKYTHAYVIDYHIFIL